MDNRPLVKEICPTSTQEWIKKGALLVDVREKDEVDKLSFDVPNIINIPLSEFEERYIEIPLKSRTVVVSNDPNKSLLAAGFLINHGYKIVVNMKYGLARWVQKGFATKGDTSLVNKENVCCSNERCN